MEKGVHLEIQLILECYERLKSELPSCRIHIPVLTRLYACEMSP